VKWLTGEALKDDKHKFATELAHMYLKTKHKAWEYEFESRIIRQTAGQHKFTPDTLALKEIVFGLRTSQANMDLVMRLAQDYAGCRKFSQCIRDGSEFGITTKLISV
jgi:hypothetical protein